eukprot:TRINITY_DN78165_c0_g1_i1.p1 TRINITY_DN78165_c0_g1~~TRINITY_DN78165_c0_g1_i1.p1  ORF type:complete len:447 (-),score=79.71 TRINITY_DN78165_c0_g1_i1:63-1370(-)
MAAYDPWGPSVAQQAYHGFDQAYQAELMKRTYPNVPFPYAQYAMAPDGYLHALALPGGYGYFIVPEGSYSPEPVPVVEEKEPPKKKKKEEVVVRPKPSAAHTTAKRHKISEEVSRRLQVQLQAATRGVSLKKLFAKYDGDRSGTLSSAELKKLIRKELRITVSVLSDSDIDNLTFALDDDGEGTVSIEELLDFIERGSATFFSAPPPEGDEDSDEAITPRLPRSHSSKDGAGADHPRDKSGTDRHDNQSLQKPGDGEEPKAKGSEESEKKTKSKNCARKQASPSRGKTKEMLAAMKDRDTRMLYLPFGTVPIGNNYISAASSPRRSPRSRKLAPFKPLVKDSKDIVADAGKGSDKRGGAARKEGPPPAGGEHAAQFHWLRGAPRTRTPRGSPSPSDVSPRSGGRIISGWGHAASVVRSAVAMRDMHEALNSQFEL